MMYINGVWMGVYEIIYIHRCMDVYQCVVYIHSWVGGCMSVYGVCGGGGGVLMYMHRFQWKCLCNIHKEVCGWVSECDVQTQVCV